MKTIGSKFYGRRSIFIIAIIFCSVSMLMLSASVNGAEQKPIKGTMSFNDFTVAVNKSLKGKTVAWVPQVAEGLYLHKAWGYGIKAECKRLGMNFILRDPNWNTAAQAQAIASLIAEKPDVILVQNANVTVNAKLLEQAEKAGIYVISVNLHSNYVSTGYVGADYNMQGRMIAEELCKYATSEGRSGKIAILGGESTSAASVDQIAAGMEVIKKNPKVQVVSIQMANWLAPRAHDITASLIQQHPDLCAIWGMYDHADSGAGAAVKEAGKFGKIAIFSSGGGEPIICDKVKEGLITRLWTWNSMQQGRDIMRMVEMLLQSGIKPGSQHFAMFTDTREITKDNADCMCWDIPKNIDQGFYSRCYNK